MQIKGYTIIRELSRGPITTSFLATQNTLDRPVLLKVLNVQWRHESDLVERFRREAKIYARLKHPNIVTIFDFGISDDFFYLAMEFVAGQDLTEFIKSHRSIPLEVVIYITREILKGLAYAHQQGVLHRDLKPSNIMIGNDGGVKITDFGLATIADLPSITNQDAIIGTPAYMSPEQAQGTVLDARSDLFSLGATLYEMVSGKSPFLDQNLAMTINRVLQHHPEPLRKALKDVPGWLSELIEQLMQKEAHQRPATALSILEYHQQPFSQIDSQTLQKFFTLPGLDFNQDLPGFTPATKISQRKFRYLYIVFALFSVIVILGLILTMTTHSTSLTKNPSELLPQRPDDSTASTASSQEKIQPPITQPVVENPISGKADQSPMVGNLKGAYDSQPSLVSDELLSASQKNKSSEASTSTAVSPIPGKLFISCLPWADIYIDSQYVETTPLNKPLVLNSGWYDLRLTNPAFSDYQSKIFVYSDSLETLKVKLLPLMGYLTVQVIPWGKIFIDGQYYETTPLSGPLLIPAGEHVIKISNPDFSEISDSINVTAGRTIEKKYSLIR